MIILHMVIPGFWSLYLQATSALLTANVSSWNDYSDFVFPRMAKCLYKVTGPSGSDVHYDALCLLPLNVFNQKIFVIIWLWYIFQLIISVGDLIYWGIILYSKNFRIGILRRRTMSTLSRKQIFQATEKAHIGNCFVLSQIARNTNIVTFVELMTELSMNKPNHNIFHLNGEKS